MNQRLCFIILLGLVIWAMPMMGEHHLLALMEGENINHEDMNHGDMNHKGDEVSIASVFTKSDEFDFDPPKPGSYSLPNIKATPDGQLIDIDGKQHNLHDILQGKISLVSFVYLNCDDEHGCPLALSTLFEIYYASQQIPTLRDKVQLLVISFDPRRDTVEAIKDFSYPLTSDGKAEQRLEMRAFTTHHQADIAPILRGFGQAVDRSGHAEKINHLLRMYLVDGQREIRNIYGLGLMDPRLMMGDVETLLLADETH